MDIFKVGFIGHREVENFHEVEEQLRQTIAKLLEEKEYVEFYVGRHGDFDILVASAIKYAQREFGSSNSSLILVLPYPVVEMESYQKYYDDVIIPKELNSVYFKAAIEKRNEWIIDRSDLLIMHVVRSDGNSALCLEKAQNLDKKIIILPHEE